MTREEALKVANEMHQWVKTDREKEALETLIPELKESEDERIIKTLQEYLKTRNWNLGGPTQDEVLAWLEKQKYDRMKPIYDARESFESALEKAWNDYHNGYENVDKLEDNYVQCAHAKGFREGYLFGIEKQEGQKPEQYSPLCNTIKDKIQEYVANNFVADTVVKTDVKSIVKAMEEGVRLGKEEQKPGDNETEVQKAYREGKNAGRKEVFDHPEYYGLQPRRMYDYETGERNPEWSEEDEKVRKWLLEYFYLHRDDLRGASVTSMEVLSFLDKHPGKGEEDIEEFEFNPQPGEKFWVRCKTNKTVNLWFDKDDERPAYAVTDPSGIITYIVHIKKDGTGNCVSYQDKEKFLETFDILESKR